MLVIYVEKTTLHKLLGLAGLERQQYPTSTYDEQANDEPEEAKNGAEDFNDENLDE